MSEVLNSIINNTSLNGKDTFVDADTIRGEDGEKYRIQGMDAPEISKVLGGRYGGATAGGIETTSAMQRLAREQGFTNVVKLDQRDPFGRQMIDLRDDKGNSFTTKIISSGALESNAYTKRRDADAATIRSLFDDQMDRGTDTFKKGADEIRAAIESEERSDKLFRSQAIDELNYVRGGGSSLSGYVSAATMFDNPDRDLQNNANNPVGEAFETGLINVVESAYGVASIFGNATGIEAIEEFGEGGAARARGRIADQAGFLVDYKDVNGFGDAIQFLANNFAMSLPYMGMTIASTLVNPVVGLTTMSSVYTGQTWNEMEGENKNVPLAIGSGILQATIDRLSLNSLLVGFGGSKLTVKDQWNEIVNAYRKANGGLDVVSKEAGELAVSNATRLEIANLSTDAAALAKDQLNKRAVAMDFLKRISAGAATEGTTEALQESIGYVSAHTVDGFDFGELQERAVGAFVAGGALGGTFGAGGGAINTAAWADVAYGVDREDPADVAAETEYARQAEEDSVNELYQTYLQMGIPESEAMSLARAEATVQTTDEIAREYRIKAEASPSFDQVEDRYEREKARRKSRSAPEVISESVGNIPALYRGQVRQSFSDEVLRKSKTARKLSSMFGGFLQRVHGGPDYENAKHHYLTGYKNSIVTDPNKLFRTLNNNKPVRRKDKERISREIYNLIDENGNVKQAELDAHPNKDQLKFLINDLENLANIMHTDQSKYNPNLGKLKNYLLRYKALNKLAIVKNRAKFIKILKQEYSELSDNDAVNITDSIINNEYDLDEAFSVLKGGPQPTSHKKRTLGLSTKKDANGNLAFDEFFEQDIFINASTAAKSAARYVANEQFIGQNGKIIAKMLDEMQQEGVSQEEVDYIAFRMKNYLDSESGNYKRPTSEFGKTLEKIQKNFMLITMVAGLPLSTISSFVEVALGSRGLTRDQIFGKPGKEGGLSKLGKEFAAMLNSGMTEITNGARLTDKEQQYETLGRKRLKASGFYEWDVGAATTTGVLETHSYHQKLVEGYFKWNGLQGWTNFNRATRAAIFGDFLMDNLEILNNRDSDTQTRTNREREAEEKLRNLGLDVSFGMVPKLIKFFEAQSVDDSQDFSVLGLSPNDMSRIDMMMREAQYSFVTEAVAQPKASNRPLYYLDPRFALLNQFQGFMSTFTANHIPRLWNEYIKRGSPAMRYTTFAMMATMIMLGFASQYLKDMIKYGGKTPYLDEAEYIRRGILSSGLAGTSERIIEQMFPIYETRSKNAGEWVVNTASGESPSLANVLRFGQAAGHLAKGEVPEAAWDVSKATVGPAANVFENIYNQLSKDTDTWNY